MIILSIQGLISQRDLSPHLEINLRLWWNIEFHSAERARICATFWDSQETAIVEFVKEHPELYDKDKQKKEALWAEISVELKLQPFDVRRWFESQRTHYGKLSKLQSGQAPREMTKRQS